MILFNRSAEATAIFLVKNYYSRVDKTAMENQADFLEVYINRDFLNILPSADRRRETRRRRNPDTRQFGLGS